jgi:hypothetical protein
MKQSRYLFWILASPLVLGVSWGASLPPIGAPGFFGDGQSIPFGNDQYDAYQQLYDHSLFPGSIAIAGLTFFTNNDPRNPWNHDPLDPTEPLIGEINNAHYTINLGVVPYGTVLTNDLDANFAFATASASFFDGTLSGPAAHQFTILSNLNEFIYDPSQGDLLLDVRQSDSVGPALTLGVDYNNDFGNGLSIAFHNLPSPNIDPDCTVLNCVASDLGLVTQFETAGESQSTPLLPDIDSNGSFVFTDQPSGSWFDPATAFGFHYLGTGGTLFTSITFPTGFASSFNLLDGSNGLLGTFNGGDSFSFGLGVGEFSITGIAPPVDPTDPSAFPLLINFQNPTGSFQMDALFPPPPATGTPEPGTMGLWAAGAITLGLIRKSRRG